MSKVTPNLVGPTIRGICTDINPQEATMRKFLTAGILAVFTLFLPSKSHAVPLDTPYKIIVDTVSVTGNIVLSTTNFPSANTSVNSSTSTYNWCIAHLVVSAVLPSVLTMYWGQEVGSPGTTDYVVVTSTGFPYDSDWSYRTPYCAPVGNNALTIHDSIATSTITLEGFLYTGWNP